VVVEGERDNLIYRSSKAPARMFSSIARKGQAVAPQGASARDTETFFASRGRAARPERRRWSKSGQSLRRALSLGSERCESDAQLPRSALPLKVI
jgi:hypothetical protein